MRPLRFCFVTTFYPPHNFGGDGIGIQRFARGLVRRGHRVTVVHNADAFDVLHHGDPPAPIEEPEGLDVVTLRSPVPPLSVLLTHQIGRPLIHAATLRKVVDHGEFDVVNFHNISLAGGPGVLSYGGDALRLYMAHEHWLICPTHVLWRHGRERCTGRECLRCQFHYRRPPQLFRNTDFMERQLDHVDTFIAMSEFSRKKHAEFGFERPMEVLPYFLPPAEEGSVDTEAPPHPRPYFLFVGRLEKIKGLQEVIPLFAQYTGADLLIAGDGDYAGELKAMARDVEGVRFLGRVSPEDLERYYAHTLAVIVPSLCFETFGIILIEAFRYGAPVIARRLGPFPEIVGTSGGGILFDDAPGLLQAMRQIQGDPEARRTLGEAARKAFDTRWVEDAVIPRYLDIVRRAAQRRGRHDIADALSHVEAG